MRQCWSSGRSSLAPLSLCCRPYHEDPSIELIKAQEALAFARRGEPIPDFLQPAPPPTDEAVGGYLGDPVGSQMRFWSDLTRPNEAAVRERIARDRA